MENSRDSSVWRSLAVAFGDGVAFGVGVKLSRSATALASGVSGQPEAETGPLAGRLQQMERRLLEMEKAKATAPAPAAFDQKVLEAIVNAVDARLKEQAGSMDRRISELEARVTTELKALRQQDENIATAVEAHMEELQDHFIAQVEAVRQQMDQDQAAMQFELAAAAKAASETAMQAASESFIEARLAPVRAQVVEKDREIAALRQRVEDSDVAVFEVLNGIGDVIRQASERRIASSAPTSPAAPPPEPAAPGGPDAGGTAEDQAPTFAQAAKPNRLWRVPLVSSIVMTAFGLIMVHYL
jgi:hypothetical protein